MQSKQINTVVIMSLGQLHNSSVSTGIYEFADLFHQHWGLPSFLYPASIAYSVVAYGADMLWYGSIDSYKKGELTDQQFKSYLKSWFGSTISDHAIEGAWNSVCNLGVFSSQNCESLKKFLTNNPNVTVLLLSSTNPMNFAHSSNDLESNDQIKFGLSYERGTLSLQEIAKNAISNLEFDHLVSLHRDLKAVYYTGNFSDSFEYNPSKDGYVGDYLDSLVKQQALEL